MSGVFIAAARRSPIGRFGGCFKALSAVDLGSQVSSDMIARAGVNPAEIDEVIIGQVLQGGAGQNPGRQSAIHAGIPDHVPAFTVNMVCGGGQKSIHMAAQAIKAGDAELVVAGGQDSMSNAPHFLPAGRFGKKMGDMAVRDMMIVDGLWDAFHDVHMGTTVEGLARRYQIIREQQDQFAVQSQQKAAVAQETGAFDAEIAPIRLEDGETIVRHDEHPRATTIEKLSTMAPAFDREGSITAGNSSGINDGASAILVGQEKRLGELGIEPMARIASYASFATAPMDMGLGPVGASRLALEKAGWTVDDLDVIEVNEAFAAQALAVQREMGWDPRRCNPNGGAIALGHPLAASGNRIVVTLAHEMVRRNHKRGLATLCIGGGMGVAICLER